MRNLRFAVLVGVLLVVGTGDVVKAGFGVRAEAIDKARIAEVEAAEQAETNRNNGTLTFGKSGRIDFVSKGGRLEPDDSGRPTDGDARAEAPASERLISDWEATLSHPSQRARLGGDASAEVVAAGAAALAADAAKLRATALPAGFPDGLRPAGEKLRNATARAWETEAAVIKGAMGVQSNPPPMTELGPALAAVRQAQGQADKAEKAREAALAAWQQAKQEQGLR